MPAAAPVVQAARAQSLSRPAALAQVEEKAAPRTRDPLARAMDALPAAPVPTTQANAPQTLVSAHAAMMRPVVQEASATTEKTDALLAAEGESESLRFDLRSAHGSTSTQPGSFASALSQTHLPRGIAMQLGEAVRAMPDRPVEVALSPDELGRVRLSISTSEGGVMLHVLAERPETLDLMRRHADQLARELASLGFGSIDLSFGQGRDPESGDDGPSDGPKGGRGRATDDTETALPTGGPANRMTLSPSGGLDIRI